MKREGSSEAGKSPDAGNTAVRGGGGVEIGLNRSRAPNPWSQNTIALLLLAVFLVLLSVAREFYLTRQTTSPSFNPSPDQTVMEIEDSQGKSKVYTSFQDTSLKDALTEAGAKDTNLDETKLKKDSKIMVRQNGSVTTGLMSGEKHLIFSIPLDINKAFVQDFEALPGIGPKLAEDIVATRQRLRGFKTMEDLKKVKGISVKKLKKIRKYVTVHSD